jgi:magnesium-transporting ATPase (P-type)
LKGFSALAPPLCKIVRNGQVAVLQAAECVIGDIIVLKAGDKIPADLRLLWVDNLKVIFPISFSHKLTSYIDVIV